jgi:hypothetical protein
LASALKLKLGGSELMSLKPFGPRGLGAELIGQQFDAVGGKIGCYRR